jgi:hypothetical protein
VADLDLTNKVPAPVTNAAPVLSVKTSQYTGPVEWSVTGSGAMGADRFQSGVAYTATARLAAGSSYAFKSTPDFIHDGVTPYPYASPNGDGTVTVTMNFPATAAATVVTDLDLTGKIPVPVRNAPPAQTVAASQYTGPVAWSVTGGSGTLSGNFQPDTAYTATARLSAASGYAFKGTPAFTHTGALSVRPVSPNGDGTVTVTIDFPATAATVVTDLILTDKVPAPVTNAPPAQTVAASQYAGPVAWSVTGGGGTHSGNFQPGTAYTATARLTANSGYAFAGTPVFTHAASVPSVSPNGNGTVTVTMSFPATAALVCYVDAARGDNSKDGRTAETAFKTLEKALSVPFAGDAREIRVTGYFLMSGPLAIDSQGKTTTITSADAQSKPFITRTDGKDDSVIMVTGGGQVIFKDVTIDGKNTGTPGVFHRGLKVTGAGTTVTLDAGTTVTGKLGPVDGGGIFVDGGAALVMKDGSVVTGSQARWGGGVYAVGNGTFKMTGGTISGNVAIGDGGFGLGGGVYVDIGYRFEMSGNAKIRENSGDMGGGVYLNTGTLEMKGTAEISSNKAAKEDGGGMYIDSNSVITMGDGVKISQNTAKRDGGGAFLRSSTLEMKGSVEISSNEAIEDGGGISSGNGCVITMSGSVRISGNKAKVGGGVAVGSDTFTMDGGTISGNQAAEKGGGVLVYNFASRPCVFFMTGGTVYGSDVWPATLKNTAPDGAALYKNPTGTAVWKNNPISTTDSTLQ